MHHAILDPCALETDSAESELGLRMEPGHRYQDTAPCPLRLTLLGPRFREFLDRRCQATARTPKLFLLAPSRRRRTVLGMSPVCEGGIAVPGIAPAYEVKTTTAHIPLLMLDVALESTVGKPEHSMEGTATASLPSEEPLLGLSIRVSVRPLRLLASRLAPCRQHQVLLRRRRRFRHTRRRKRTAIGFGQADGSGTVQ